MKARIGVYPGTFDPITNGHTDIIRRALHVVDRLVIGVARNDGKGPLFSTDERVEIVRDEVANLDKANLEKGAAGRIEVRPFETLLMSFAESVKAGVIIRGLRAVSDFEYEFQMAGMNRNLYPDVEFLFLTPAEQYLFISATMVREIASLGGDVSKFVQPRVARALAAKVGKNRK